MNEYHSIDNVDIVNGYDLCRCKLRQMLFEATMMLLRTKKSSEKWILWMISYKKIHE